MGVDFNTNKGDLTVQVRKGYGISMDGEREGKPEAKNSDCPVRFVIAATNSLIEFNQ
jgi:hypothetical protein